MIATHCTRSHPHFNTSQGNYSAGSLPGQLKAETRFVPWCLMEWQTHVYHHFSKDTSTTEFSTCHWSPVSQNLQTLGLHFQLCKLQQSIACSVLDTTSQVLQNQFCLSSKTKPDHTTHPQQSCLPTTAREVYDLSWSPWFCNAYSTQGDQLRVIKSDFHAVHFPQGMSEQQHCLIQPKQYSISIKGSLPCF